MSEGRRKLGDVLDGREDGGEHLTITRAQNAYVGWAMTLLLYIVVLNLLVEYVDSIVIDSFTISIFTSVVLLALLVVILGLEHRVHEYFETREGTSWKITGTAATLGILVLGKFVILEVIDIVFGEHVDLGGFVEVLLIVLVLIVSQKLGVLVWKKLGDPSTGSAADIIDD